MALDASFCVSGFRIYLEAGVRFALVSRQISKAAFSSQDRAVLSVSGNITTPERMDLLAGAASARVIIVKFGVNS